MLAAFREAKVQRTHSLPKRRCTRPVSRSFCKRALVDSANLMEIITKGKEIHEKARTQAIQRARGELPPIPQGTELSPNLRGRTVYDTVLTYRPVSSKPGTSPSQSVLSMRKATSFVSATSSVGWRPNAQRPAVRPRNTMSSTESHTTTYTKPTRNASRLPSTALEGRRRTASLRADTTLFLASACSANRLNE